MDISSIEPHIEKIAADVHNAWLVEKKQQGFHPPLECKTFSAKRALKLDLDLLGHNEGQKFHKFCHECHTDMYPYEQLPENIKDYDRVTVSAVLRAIAGMEVHK